MSFSRRHVIIRRMMKLFRSLQVAVVCFIVYAATCQRGDPENPPDETCREVRNLKLYNLKDSQGECLQIKLILEDGVTPPDTNVEVLYTGKNAGGVTIHWQAIDIDDPAGDNDIDPNSVSGDDNWPIYEVDPPPPPDSFLSNTITLTDKNGFSSNTIRLIGREGAHPNGSTLYYFNGGDNYSVRAYTDSVDTIETGSITLWKRMNIEYDYMSGYGVSFDMMDKAFSRDPYNENADLSCYIEDEEINDGVLSPLSIDTSYLWQYHLETYGYRAPVHLIGAVDAYYLYPDGSVDTMPDVAGLTFLSYAMGQSASFIFVDNIKEGGYGDWEIAKTVVHELGHQIAYLTHTDHDDDDCLMHQGYASNLLANPHFCSKCVAKLRKYPLFRIL